MAFLVDRGIVRVRQDTDEEEISRISAFIPLSSLPALSKPGDSPDHLLRKRLFEDIFLANGRISHCERLMGTYPHYLQRHTDLMDHILKGPGSLEVSWRHYLAFMAAAANQCESLMEIEEERCKAFGGDKAWFRDTTSVPQKLRSLGEINVKLAHRPWDLQTQDLQKLMGSWRLVDLTEAVIIMVQFHAMSSFSAGLGVLPECDLALDGPRKERRMSFSSVAEGIRSNNPGIIRTLLNFQVALESACSEDMLDTVDAEDLEDMCEVLAGGSVRYVTYDPSHRPFYASDFNWRNHGYEIVERLMPRTAQLLNDTLAFTYSMTDNSLCSVPQVDSSPLRRAIWNYTQKVYGLDYDDYNYREVNVLLSRHTKAYLKKAACVPHQLESEDFAQVDLGVTAEEMVHTMLLVMEARKESELLYWLYTLNLLQ